MRKYTKMMLYVFAVLCFALLLYYKHEYDRMVDVFRMLNTFGDPMSADRHQLPVSDQQLLAQAARAAAADLPKPHWQSVAGTSLHLYSAVSVAGAARGRAVVSVLAVSAGGSEPPAADELMCWLWCEGDGEVAGRVSLARLPGAASFSSWQLNCSLAASSSRRGVASVANLGVVYAVGVASTAQHRLGIMPVLVSVIPPATAVPHAREAGPGPDSSLGVCMIPEPSVPAEPAHLAEFVAFQSAVGVTQLWLYDPMPSLRLRRLLLRWSSHTSSSSSSMAVHRLSWQFPVVLHSEADRSLAAAVLARDCRARAAGLVQYMVTLNVSEFVVPSSVASVVSVYQTMAEQLRQPDVELFSLTRETFCTDAPDGVYSQHAPFLLINTKTSLAPSLSLADAVLIVRSAPRDAAIAFGTRHLPSTLRHYRINPVVMAVHLYAPCGADNANRTQQDTKAVRHKQRVVRSFFYTSYRQMRDEMLLRKDGDTGSGNVKAVP